MITAASERKHIRIFASFKISKSFNITQSSVVSAEENRLLVIQISIFKLSYLSCLNVIIANIDKFYSCND